MDFKALKFLILDVDGVLTDGGLYIGPDGETIKRFHVQDGLATKRWRQAGGLVGISSGRRSEALLQRARELGIDLVRTGQEDKLEGFDSLIREAGCGAGAVVYVGDDVPDLPLMARAGFPVAVANAVPAVKRVAAYVTRRSGGAGAVAEVIELILRKQRAGGALAGATS